MHIYEHVLSSPKHTSDLGQKVARLLDKTNALILLRGDLGAGKTTFAQGFMKELMPNQPITSPTYSYMNIYEASSLIFHFDLYRINSSQELEELGLWEHLLDSKAIRLVEWPEQALGLESYADVSIDLFIINDHRQAHVSYFKSLGSLLDSNNIG